MLVAMAGLPGTGKSTLAGRLAAAVGGVVLCKDAVRAALFPPPALDYSAGQNDLCMEAVYAAAAHILRRRPGAVAVIDGRTFTRRDHVARLRAVAAGVGTTPTLIECVCADEVARRRLEHDRAAGTHPAGDRTYELYLARKAAADPLPDPRLVIDTGVLSLDAALARCLGYLSDV